MKLKRNIPLIYIISSLMWGRFFIPVLALFYVASQVPLNEFAIIMGIFSLSILIFEIPTGALADLLGKKKTLLLSRFMYIIEIFLLAFFNGFWIFLIAKIISGIGVSLSSGTDQALLFDTLKKQKREGEHKKISGTRFVISNISMAFVFIIGAYLFSLNNKLPAIASLPLVSLGFILTFFLEEPYKLKKKLNFKSYFNHIKESWNYFRQSDFIKYISIMSFFTAATISIVLSMSSAYFEKILIPISIIGVLAFISSMITAFSSKKAHKWEEFLGERKSILIIQLFIIFGIFSISLMIPYWGFLCYLLIPFISGFESVIINDYINNHINTSHRATLISINSMAENTGIFLLFLLVGYIEKIKNLQISFLILGLIILLGFIFLYIYSKKLNINFKTYKKL